MSHQRCWPQRLRLCGGTGRGASLALWSEGRHLSLSLSFLGRKITTIMPSLEGYWEEYKLGNSYKALTGCQDYDEGLSDWDLGGPWEDEAIRAVGHKGLCLSTAWDQRSQAGLMGNALCTECKEHWMGSPGPTGFRLCPTAWHLCASLVNHGLLLGNTFPPVNRGRAFPLSLSHSAFCFHFTDGIRRRRTTHMTAREPKGGPGPQGPCLRL